mgnify:CR=1 FL=1
MNTRMDPASDAIIKKLDQDSGKLNSADSDAVSTRKIKKEIGNATTHKRNLKTENTFSFTAIGYLPVSRSNTIHMVSLSLLCHCFDFSGVQIRHSQDTIYQSPDFFIVGGRYFQNFCVQVSISI